MALTAPPINYLLFADDILLFVKAGMDGAAEIAEVLDVHCNAGYAHRCKQFKERAFKYLKHRVWGKVQGWMEQTLSSGGKEVLIKSVAQAVPTYSMTCFKLPRGLCLKINSSIRNFWWGSKQGKRKTH